jgi:hypothetical protein
VIQEAVVKKALVSSYVLAGVLLGAAGMPVEAQEAASAVPLGPARSLVPAKPSRWDASGSLGLLAITTSDTHRSWGGWEQKADYRFDVGRYWTTHLKTDVAITAAHPWEDYESEPLPIPGAVLPYVYTSVDRRLFMAAPAVTWQFRENAFMHPYVSGGVKVGVLHEHRSRDASTQRFGAVSYPVPPLDERRTTVVARPFVAGGFKSYISRAVFTRTELRLGFAQDGVRQVSVIAGVGVDF